MADGGWPDRIHGRGSDDEVPYAAYPTPGWATVRWGGTPNQLPNGVRRRGLKRLCRLRVFSMQKRAFFDTSPYKLFVNPDKEVLKGRRVYGKRKRKKKSRSDEK
jgi:hypothetical protein